MTYYLFTRLPLPPPSWTLAETADLLDRTITYGD